MSAVNKFLTILKLELADAQEDLIALQLVYDHRHAEGEISDYVYKNNATVFKREIASIADIVQEITCCGNDFPTVAAVEAAVLQRIEQAVHTFDYPQAVKEICTRKISKVRRFVMLELD